MSASLGRFAQLRAAALKATSPSAVRHHLDRDVEALGEGVDHLLDQHFRRRGAGGDAERRDALEPRPVDLVGALDQHRERAAGALRHLAQPLRVGGVRRADHDHRVDRGATRFTASWRLVVA